MSGELCDRYLALVDEMGLFSSSENLEFFGSCLFDRVPLMGRSVLDIGGGDGTYSFLAASLGASDVLCLEPEAAGATSGVRARFERVHEQLGSPAWVRQESFTLQQFDEATQFDVILLSDSINHLDEESCIALKEKASAKDIFRGIFTKLHGVAAPGAHLIVTDCSRYNLFGMLGVRNPIAPSIEWHKHQSPYLWSKLLQEVGFRNPRVGWTSFNRLGRPGRAVLGNVVASFFLNSHFRLVLEN